MKLMLEPTNVILQRRGLQVGGRVQKFIDSEVLRYSIPYIPKRSSILIKSGNVATKLGSGEVKYDTPYAQYQYHGKVMVGRAPKRLTDIALKYIDAPQRGALWFERMKVSKKKTILLAAAKLAGGKAK